MTKTEISQYQQEHHHWPVRSDWKNQLSESRTSSGVYQLFCITPVVGVLQFHCPQLFFCFFYHIYCWIQSLCVGRVSTVSELSSLLLFSADISERRPTGSKVQLDKFTARLWCTDRPRILLRKWVFRFVVMGYRYLRGLNGCVCSAHAHCFLREELVQ